MASSPLSQRSAGAVVADYLRTQVEAIVAAEPAVRDDAADAVHKMRVAIRRLRSTLATYRRLLDRETTEHIRGELRWLGGVLGPVRDAEVIRDHLDGVLDDEPATADSEVVRTRVRTTLERQHSEAHQVASSVMSGERYRTLLYRLQTLDRCVLDTERARRRADKELHQHVRRAHRRMHRALDEALLLVQEGQPADESVHEVRKAAKRVRYAAESVREAYGAKAEKLAAAMEEVQETLGDHQDTVVIREVVHRLARDASAADEDTFVYGRIDALEQVRGEAARQAWLDAAQAGAFDPPGWLR